MEFHYQDLVVQIHPHPEGQGRYGLHFRPGSPQTDDPPPEFHLTLTREGLLALAKEIQQVLGADG